MPVHHSLLSRLLVCLWYVSVEGRMAKKITVQPYNLYFDFIPLLLLLNFFPDSMERSNFILSFILTFKMAT